MDDGRVSLRDARKRIRATDLVPGRSPTRDGIERYCKALEKRGIATLAELRGGMKAAQRRKSPAKASGIELR